MVICHIPYFLEFVLHIILRKVASKKKVLVVAHTSLFWDI